MGVRHYKLTLTTVGPVHIGNGVNYSGKDYFKLDDKRVAVLDAKTFVSRLSPEEVDEYCEFLGADSGNSLAVFLGRHPRLEFVARECVAYRIEMKLAKARRGTDQYFPVAQFVKDAHGCPYVPGSSVKGMLRTALLAYLVQRNPERYAALYDARATQGNDKSRACKQIEREVFWRERPNASDEVVNDIMRYVSVSDSVPLSTDDLVFAKKYDKFSRADSGRHKLGMGKISKEAQYYEGNALNIYRECIRPGTRIELTLDVDERIDAYLDGLTLDDKGLLSVLEASFGLYERCFLDRFDLSGVSGAGGGGGAADDGRCRYVYQGGPLAGRRCRNRSVGDTGYCNTHKDQAGSGSKEISCCIGGGVDFDSKTIVNALFGEGRDRVYEISRILYAQFPTKLDRSLHQELEADVRDAGFMPMGMRAMYRKGKLSKGKDDHRHWKDAELGVSPHTVKLGEVGGQKYLMGRCSLAIGEAQ